jgi:hypothetical protein
MAARLRGPELERYTTWELRSEQVGRPARW